MNIILASSSPFRKQLLDRLHLDYQCISPDVDETLLNDESPDAYVRRLAQLKAETVALNHPDAVVIGSDQCAVIDDAILGKPGNFDRAFKQLKSAQGKTAYFNTGLCVSYKDGAFCETDNILFEVGFRQLSDAQITHYLHTEEPYQCAGSFKSEAYGVSLFSKMKGDDPTALMGLPLIRLIQMLEQAGVKVI